MAELGAGPEAGLQQHGGEAGACRSSRRASGSRISSSRRGSTPSALAASLTSSRVGSTKPRTHRARIWPAEAAARSWPLQGASAPPWPRRGWTLQSLPDLLPDLWLSHAAGLPDRQRESAPCRSAGSPPPADRHGHPAPAAPPWASARATWLARWLPGQQGRGDRQQGSDIREAPGLLTPGGQRAVCKGPGSPLPRHRQDGAPGGVD
jgi:hypothetical protein